MRDEEAGPSSAISYVSKDGRPPKGPRGDFRNERHANETRASTTGPEAGFCRRARHREAELACRGHVVLENRCGPAVDAGGLPVASLAKAAA